MRKRSLLLLSLILIGFIACDNKQRQSDKNSTLIMEPSTVVDFQELKSKPLEKEIKGLFFNDPIFIKLKNKDSNTAFGKISLIKIVNDKIYILDGKMKTLVVYGMDGNAISKIGSYGQGPHEYLDIASFDVDKSGNIYTIDGRLDKLFIYDDTFNYVSSVKLPFDADHIQLLENGHYMFALSSWNKGACEGQKIAITDKELNVIESYLPYDEYRDDNYWISDYQLIKTTEYIIYNRPIDNNVYLFSLDGKLLKSVQIDFGRQNVPDEMKKDIERNLREFDNYSLLKNFVVITPQFIAGTIWKNRESKLFLLDKQGATVYLSKKLEDSDNTHLAGFRDSTMITYIDPDYDDNPMELTDLPIDIREHLDNGDFVVCIQHIK